jgi:Tfp pilus assembly protein PilO
VTARLSHLSTRAQIALVCGSLLLVAVLGYFVLISPKRSTAADLKKQTAAVQTQIDANRSTAFTQALPAVRSAPVFSLAQAMPKQIEMPNMILQLNQAALDSGITFDTISPQSSSSSGVAGTTDPFAVQPIQVQFTGSFYNLVSFLMRLRNFVRVENGKLYSTGRLFDVSSIGFASGPKGFPTIQAALTLNAFVPVAPQLPTSTSSTTTGTTSTSTGTTTTTSNSASASPAGSGGGS